MYSHNKVNFDEWVTTTAPILQPPNTSTLLNDQKLQTMLVTGPHYFDFYHINPTEEWFYQLKGQMLLKIIYNGQKVDIVINEGDHFLLPPNTPHAPQNPESAITLVIETQRPAGKPDRFAIFCNHCNNMLFEETFIFTSLADKRSYEIETFYDKDVIVRTCAHCGEIIEKPTHTDEFPDSSSSSRLNSLNNTSFGADSPIPMQLKHWLSSDDDYDKYHGNALNIDKLSLFSPTNKKTQQMDGERWIYTHNGGCFVELFSEIDQNSHIAERTVSLEKGDSLLIAPHKSHKISVTDPLARILICTHKPSH